MSAASYRVGFRAGYRGHQALKHRKGKPYNSGQAQKGYDLGYSDGCKVRRIKGSKLVYQFKT